tara:strand:+ start:303 stop:1547 length:1245 start_codon:yes stop_codon:yes gene_type:complete
LNFWIFQTGEPIHSDKLNLRPMRAMNLSNILISRGHKVTLWTSSFDHQNKIHRSKKFKILEESPNLKIRLIPSSGYKKNISFFRLYDHFILAKNLKQILKNEKNTPDVAFVGYPPIETAFVFTKWLKEKKVPVILDIKDLWPDIFIEIFPSFLRPFIKVLLFPYYILFKLSLGNVDGISSMSKGYLKLILKKNKRVKYLKHKKIFRLTSPRDDFSADEIQNSKNHLLSLGIKDDLPIIFFAGTFMSVFDFDTIKKSIELLNSKKIICQFVFCGSGEYFSLVKRLMKDLPNVFFPGWVESSSLEYLASMSVASLAPYRNIENYTFNTPNKVVDSFKYGLPLLCPLKGEVLDLISEHKVGFTYKTGEELSDYIFKLLNDEKLQKEMSQNSLKLYDREFSYNKVYGDFCSFLESLQK